MINKISIALKRKRDSSYICIKIGSVIPQKGFSLISVLILHLDLTKHIVGKYGDIEKLMDVGNDNRCDNYWKLFFLLK